MHEDLFFQYARERYSIKLRKDAGQPWPWSDDPIFQQYRFCNVFREDDKTTRWFCEHIRQPLEHEYAIIQVFAAAAFRWFNRIETWETILSGNEKSLAEIFDLWNSDEISKILLAHGSAPWVTGSYIIKTPDGLAKVEGVLWCIDQLYSRLKIGKISFICGQNSTLEGAWRALRESPFLGDFMAYEVVTDLRHTSVLRDATDIMTWANPGPGAARGLGRVHGRGTEFYNRGSESDRVRLIEGMQRLLEQSQEQKYWSREWPRWEMRDVEHTLCEYDKYMRVKTGEGRPRQIYRRIT